jgi:biopolymer transport protein ExbB/TolQ
MKESKPLLTLEALAHAATRHIGSPVSLVVHSLFFLGIFSLAFFGFTFDQILLILTTLVSLEAIYLSIFIQMTVNRQETQLAEVSEDVEDISEDVEEISKDVEEISEDIDDIQEDVEELSEAQEGEEAAESAEEVAYSRKIERIEATLGKLVEEVQSLKKR